MELITTRLKLRKHENTDADNFQYMLSDERVRKFTGGIKEKTKSEIHEYFRKLKSEFSSDINEITHKGCNFRFAIEYKNTYIGYCGIEFCDTMNELELFYGLNYDYWGKGFALEAISCLLDYAFKDMKLNAVFAAVNPNNLKSSNLLSKCGFVFVSKIEWPNQGYVNKLELKKNQWLTISST